MSFVLNEAGEFSYTNGITCEDAPANITYNGNWTVGGNLVIGSGATNLFQITTHGAVTQASSITTAVTCNATAGVITTVSSSLSAGSTTSFTVNNSVVASTSMIYVCLNGYSGTIGTNGFPNIFVNTIASGSFVIDITNTAGSNALSGTLTIAFLVIN